MATQQRKNVQRESEVRQLLGQHFPGGTVDTQTIQNFGKLAARILKEGSVRQREFKGGNCWELYNNSERDFNASGAQRVDTDFYGLTDDGRFVCVTERELESASRFDRYEKERREYTPGARDLIQLDLLFEENEIHGVLEAFLKDGGRRYHVSPNDPHVLRRIRQEEAEKQQQRAIERPARTRRTLAAVAVIIFLANLVLCLLPFFQGGGFSLANAANHSMDYPVYAAVSLLSVIVLSLSAGYQGGGPGFVVSWIWTFVFFFGGATVHYTKLGYGSGGAGEVWKTYGLILVVMIAAMLICYGIGKAAGKRAGL